MLDLVTMEPKLAGELTAAEKYIIKSRLRYFSFLLTILIIITVFKLASIIILLLITIMAVTIRIEFWKAEETPSFICSSHRALLTSTTGLQVLLPSASS